MNNINKNNNFIYDHLWVVPDDLVFCEPPVLSQTASNMFWPVVSLCTIKLLHLVLQHTRLNYS